MLLDEAPTQRDLCLPRATQLAPSDWLVVGPAASPEQHGPHLPLGIDLSMLGGVVTSWR
jgi:creatinine amidohydrolase/Fe(II)-dependent formamide hydrolase-like protein